MRGMNGGNGIRYFKSIPMPVLITPAQNGVEQIKTMV